MVALALVVTAVIGALPRKRPSVVLVTIDTLRPDRLGCYGHRKNATPALDRLAREGMLFENAYCDVPWTTASMSSVMTGEYSTRHGVQLGNAKLKASAVTLAEILRDRGFQTGAIIGSFPLDAVFGLNQGFDVYDADFTHPMIDVPGQVIPRR